MIVGKGDIASVLPESDLLFFASGVSNSRETNEDEYAREVDLLLKQDKDSHVVYFSSLGVFYGDTRYFSHKRFMESLVKKTFKKYTIIRLGNISWGKNPNTIINNLRAKIQGGEKLEIYNEYRYIISKEEFIHWISLIPDWSCEMTLIGRTLKVADLVREIKSGKI